MILETEVLVKCGLSTDKYFESLGYKIPRRKDKLGRISVPRNSQIIVKVEHLPNGSNLKLTKVCDYCKKYVLNQEYGAIIKVRWKNDGKDVCSECSKILSGIAKKNNVKYEKSLEYNAKKSNKKYLLDEFSSKNNKTPIQVSYGDNEEYLWVCQKCKGEYPASLNNRMNGKNCPYCSGRKILVGYNDLWTTHPHIAKLLKNPQRGYELSSGMNKKEVFICDKCNHKQNKTLFSIVNQGFLSCNRCSDGISYPEKFMMSVLNQLIVTYKTQHKFSWAKDKIYDFYIEPNIIIEVHGEQHYDNTFKHLGGRSLSEEQKNDQLKERFGKSNGIKHYVIVDARKSEIEYIKNSIISSELSLLFNLKNIDWVMCHRYAITSLIIESCSLWNKGIKSTIEIGNILNRNRNTVTQYLKKGADIGLCDYDPKESIRITGRNIGGYNKKEIVQLTIDGSYIKTWESATEASNELKIPRNHIPTVCSGKRKSAYGFKWMYKEDYDKQNNLINC